MKKLFIILVLMVLLIQFSSLVSAEEDDDVEIFGMELEKLLNLGSALLAAVLAILTIIAYKRSENKRLIYVALAFILFAVKTFLMGSEIFFGEWPWIDPITSILDFVILLSFFFGVFLVNVEK